MRVIVPVLIVLVGVGIVLYPVIATTVNNAYQQKIAREYDEQFRDSDSVESQAKIEEAREYNARVAGQPILDPWLARISPDNEDYQEYLNQLSGATAMSAVSIPAIDVKLPLYHGTDESTLQKGLGHLYGSALPVGGEGTRSVITGHTGLTNATLFDDLDQLKVGDAVFINTFGETLKYEVRSTEVVLPTDVGGLVPEDGKDLLTLITCTPYGVNTHRLLVHAERVPYTPEDDDLIDDAGGVMQWWMWLLVALAAIILAALLWWVVREIRKVREP
ncbi:fimbrial associated sortase-like protein [Corynebacterium pilosum]|uniref:Fimbrial associated sortase-like protein n=2 Tax=Corynebacterium pilosum TaxID=35756 RepID=A0A376CKS7_9CORY|nr:fimbrial associated sortase-like protein [Corynebacterium pilosum]